MEKEIIDNNQEKAVKPSEAEDVFELKVRLFLAELNAKGSYPERELVFAYAAAGGNLGRKFSRTLLKMAKDGSDLNAVFKEQLEKLTVLSPEDKKLIKEVNALISRTSRVLYRIQGKPDLHTHLNVVAIKELAHCLSK